MFQMYVYVTYVVAFAVRSFLDLALGGYGLVPTFLRR